MILPGKKTSLPFLFVWLLVSYACTTKKSESSAGGVTQKLRLDSVAAAIKTAADTAKNLSGCLKENNNAYRAFSFVNGDCSTCIAVVNEWKKLAEAEQLPAQSVNLIIYQATPAKLQYLLEQAASPALMVFNDFSFSSGKANGMHTGEPQHYLVDKDLGIIEKGDLFSDPELKKKFIVKLKP